MTSPFNPAAFVKKDASDQPSVTSQKKTPYEATGNASRDGVRKILYEIFQAEDEPAAQRLAKEIEEALFAAASDDARSRVYRDKGRQVQMKLKGPRFSEQRQKLREGELTPDQVCSDEWLNAKAAAPTNPAGPGIGRGRGMPMGAGRGRGGPPVPGMRGGRGIAMPGRPPAPAFKPVPAQPLPQTDPQVDTTSNQVPNADEKPEPVVDQEPQQRVQEQVPPKEEEAKVQEPKLAVEEIKSEPKVEQEAKSEKQQPEIEKVEDKPPQMEQPKPVIPPPRQPPAQFGAPRASKTPRQAPPQPSMPKPFVPPVKQAEPSIQDKKPDPAELPVPIDQSETIETSKIELAFDDSQVEESKPDVAKDMPLSLEASPANDSKQSLDDSMMSGRGSSHGAKKKKVVKKVVKKKKVVKSPRQDLSSRVMEPEQPVVQETLVKEPPKQKPKELTPEEMQAVKAERQRIAPLTAENLQKQFMDKKPDFDIDSESILQLDDQILSTQNTVKQQPKLPSAPKSSSLQNDIEFQRLSEQLSSKKQTIDQLQSNLQMTQTDLELLKKKYEMIQEENSRIKTTSQSEKIELLKLQQTMINERKTAQELQKQQNAEIQALKEELNQQMAQNQKLRDRYQKIVVSSQDQRDRLERQMQILIEQQTGNTAHDQGRRLLVEQHHQFQNNDDQVGVNPNNQQDLQVQLAEMRRQYEQQLGSQKRQLDQALGRLEQEQKMNHKFRQNNRKLAETVMNLENGGKQVPDEEPEEEIDELPRETGSNLIDQMPMQQIAAGSGSNTNEVYMAGYVDMNHEEEMKESEIIEGQQAIQPSAFNNSVQDRGNNPNRMFFESEEATGGETQFQQNQFNSHQQSQQEAIQTMNHDLFTESGQQELGLNQKKSNQTAKGQQREQQESGKLREETKNEQYFEGDDNFNEDDEEFKSDGSSIPSDNDDDEEDEQESQESGHPGDLGSETEQQINTRSQNVRADIGGLSESNPAATMPSQNQLQGQNNQRAFGAQRANNPFGYSNSQQPQQYGTGSSGASGNNLRSSLQTQGGSQNLQASIDDGQPAGNYISQAPAAGQGGFSQGTTGSGGPPTYSQSQRRNRRGYRQQNQQPSSGANERPDSRTVPSSSANFTQSRAQNNTTLQRQGQGRQDIARSNINQQQLNLDPSDSELMISTGLGTSAAASAFGSNQPFDPTLAPGQSSSPTAGGNESRSRAQRGHNRGRQARNNQQNTVQTHQNLTQQSLPVSQSTNQQIGPEPASLSQERERNAAQSERQALNQRLARGAGSGGASDQNQQQDLSQAVQQVRPVNAPASSQSQGQFNRPSDSQSSTIQGAAHQTSQYNMPASTASHSGGPVTGATQRGHGYPGSQNQGSNQGQSNAPHGGGGVTRPQQPSQSSHQAAVMHHFDSGSTGFASNMPSANQSQEAYQNNQQQNPRRDNRHASSGSPGGVPFTQISSVSSPPSNNLGVQGNMFANQAMNMAALEPNSQSRNQQNEHSGSQNPPSIRQNTQEISGPGAVGAPPSSQTQVPAAPSRSYQQQVPNMSEESMPISSGGNQSSGNWPPVNQSSIPRQPDSRGDSLAPPMSLNQGLGGSQQPSIMNQSRQSNQMAVPQNSEGIRPNLSSSLFEEEKKQGPSQNQQQQSVVNIPSSVFGVSRDVGSGQNQFEQNQLNQQPAAFQAQQRNSQGVNLGATSTGGQKVQRPSINFSSPDMAAAASSGGMNLGNNTVQGERSNLIRNQRNNDSRKTSGANTPSKDGASTPTTQQQLQSIQGRVIGQSNQAQMPSGVSPIEFNSAVSASLNSHLQNNMGQGQMGGAQSNANNNQQQFNARPLGSSLFDEPPDTSNNNRATASLFDDFAADFQPSDQQTNQSQVIANPFANSQSDSNAQGHQEQLFMNQRQQQTNMNSGEQASDGQAKDLIPTNMFD